MAIQEKSTILNAASAIVTGPTLNLYNTYPTFTFMKRIAGTFTALTVNYEGSLDSFAWFQIGTDASLTAGATFVVDKPCRYIRASITAFTGSASPSVSVDVLPAAVV